MEAPRGRNRTGSAGAFLAAFAAALLYGAAAAAQHAPVAESQAGAHEEHGAAHATPPGQAGHAFTLNVFISDDGAEPSAAFVPAGRRVQLVLRNRGVTEHHYRVAGLPATDVRWIAEPANASALEDSDDHSGHHAREFVDWRAPSPSGIRPTGTEAHAYVARGRDVDVMLFTPAAAGTFDVRCDLHGNAVGRLTVFESAPQPAVSGGNAALTRLLTRTLGPVEYPSVAGVGVEVTYAPTEYVSRVLGPAGIARLQPDRYITLLMSEKSHAGDLPAEPEAPELRVGGQVVPLVDRKIITDSVHHRATSLRFARGKSFGRGHQVMTLRLASGQEATWHLPLVLPATDAGGDAPAGLADRWALILALLGGMLAAMWPCLFQLTVYFIPALAGVAMQEARDPAARGGNRLVLRAAFFFILGFTLVYTATGALIGYAAQRYGDTAQFEAWQRYFGVGAGILVIGLALRVAAKVRAPLVCRMPVLSRMTKTKKAATPIEMMLAGLAFATGCMTCFGSALVLVMVVYVGLAQSALYGALVLFLFSLGMGIPLVIAAIAMARTLPLLLKLERAVPWMGLASAALMIGFGVLLISGNYMLVSEWTYRVVGGGAAALPVGADGLLPAMAAALGAALLAWLAWTVGPESLRRLARRSDGA